MFCRFGSVELRPPGRRDRLVERGVDPGVGRADRLQQALDGLPQPGRVAVRQQVRQERMLGLLEQRLQRVRVGGVPGLGPLGLRHLQLVEQHHLQLLGRTEVDLLADHLVRRGGRLLDAGREPRLELLQVRPVDRDPVPLHRRDHVDQRQLHVGEQRRTGLLVQLGVERVGQVGDRPGAQHRRVRGRAALDVVEAELPVLGLLGAQLALAGSARSGRPGRTTAGPGGPDTRSAGCRRSARPASSRAPGTRAADPSRRAAPSAARSRRATPARPRRRPRSASPGRTRPPHPSTSPARDR